MDTGVQNLLEASVKLECTIETTARALILYHHFMRCVDEVEYDQSMVAAVALNLSGRINEQILEVDSLICVFYSIVNKTTEVLSPDDITFLMLRKSLVSIDFLMQRMLEFNLNHRIAHQCGVSISSGQGSSGYLYLVPFLTLIFERSKNIAEYRSELSNTCIRLLSDFYTSRNCLNYKPEHIAIACIDLSLYIHGLINDLVMVPVWYKGFCNDVNVGRIKQIKRDMMGFYKKAMYENKVVMDVSVESGKTLPKPATPVKNEMNMKKNPTMYMPITERAISAKIKDEV